MIQSIQLINFRSCRAVDLHFPVPRTLIVGANDAGKSTFADAIAWCLTGRCRGLDHGGRGVRELVRQGAKQMAVAVTLDGAGTIRRAFDGKTVKLEIETGKGVLAGPLADMQAALLARLGGVRSDVIEVACQATAFLDLDHASARDLLLRVLDVRVALDGEDFLAVQQLGLVGSVDGPATCIGDLTLDAVNALDERARQQRLDLKRRIQEMGTPQLPPLPDALLNAHPLERIMVMLATKKGEASTRFASMHQRLGERQALASQARALQADIVKIEGRIAEAGDVDRAITEAEADRIETQAMTQDTVQARAVLLTADAGQLTRVIEAIDRHSPSRGCVLDPAVPCKTSAKAFADRKPALLKKRAELERDARQAQEALDAAAASERRLREIDARIARLRGLLDTIRRDEAALQAKRDELAGAHTRLQKLGESTNERAFETLKQDIDVLGRQIELWKRHDAARLAHDERVAHLQALKGQLSLAERACEALGPKGTRAAALEAALAGFIAEIGSFLQALGVTLAIEPEPWTVLIDGRPAALMSKSGRLRAGVALQLAVVRRAGLGFAIVDEADLLDEENARTFSRLIASARIGRDGDEGSIIVLATRGKSYALPRVLGLSAVRLALDARAETQVVEATGAPDTTSVGVVATTASQ